MSDDRKYRHRGYQDSGGEHPRGPREPFDDSPAASPGAPRGRSAGIEKELVIACKKCGGKLTRVEEIGPADACPNCGTALHACVQCRHFDTAARWECGESARIPRRLAGKAAANDCPVFSPAVSFDMTGEKPRQGASEARSAFDDLFRKK